MRRIVLVFIVLLFTAGVAWAGKEAYKLVMSKDKEICAGMLKLFNADMKKYGVIRYEEHEIFTRIPWKPVELRGREPTVEYCSVVQQAKFDINNDGQDELVIKWSACLKGQPIDSLYIYPADSKILEESTWDYLSFNRETPNKFRPSNGIYYLKDLDHVKNADQPAAVGVVFLQPLVWGKTHYVSITDLQQEWIVIAKYLKGEEFKDICYFHGKSS